MKSVVQKLVFFFHTVDFPSRYINIYWPNCKCMYHHTVFSLTPVSANDNENIQAKPGNQNRGRTVINQVDPSKYHFLTPLN